MLCTSKTPRHVAIIMDGNGRWARERGMPRIKGHEEGAESARAVIRACRRYGIEYLTLYAFSVENWVRPRREVTALMQLLVRFLKKESRELHENQIRLRVMGRTGDLPRNVRRELDRVVEATRAYDRGQLILALSYGGRTEIAAAARAIARRAAAGEVDAESVDEGMVAENLYLPDVPDPDLLIRTSGEMRLSNFLLWQLSYAEFYVTRRLWPDFREAQFKRAIDAYSRRRRRFGDIEEKS
jgi:undecaprenyl diphosphate synthase